MLRPARGRLRAGLQDRRASARARPLPWWRRVDDGRAGMKEFAAEPDRIIIGVVADSRDNGLNQDPGPKMFVPQAQVPDQVNAMNTSIGAMAWVVRTRVPPMQAASAIQQALKEST